MHLQSKLILCSIDQSSGLNEFIQKELTRMCVLYSWELCMCLVCFNSQKIKIMPTLDTLVYALVMIIGPLISLYTHIYKSSDCTTGRLLVYQYTRYRKEKLILILHKQWKIKQLKPINIMGEAIIWLVINRSSSKNVKLHSFYVCK